MSKPFCTVSLAGAPASYGRAPALKIIPAAPASQSDVDIVEGYSLDVAIEQGMDAWEAGLGSGANPYDPRSEPYVRSAWVAGYLYAQKQAAR